MEKEKKGPRRWRYIGIALAVVAALIVIIIPSVVVTRNKQQQQTTTYSHGNDSNSDNSNSNNTNSTGNSNGNGNNSDNDNDDNNSNGSNATTFKPSYAQAESKYANLTRVLTLDHLSNKQRIFVLGDVHGCVNELDTMVKKLHYDRTKDAMILAGDLTSKGYDNAGVVRLAKYHGMYCVRGNHDDYVVRFKTYENLHGADDMGPKHAKLPEGDVEDPMKFGDKHADMAKNLTQEDYNFLVQCPMVIDLPFLNAQVVHGGLDPKVSDFSQNDPHAVFNMRNIKKDGVPTKKKGKGDHWTDAYATNAQMKNTASSPPVKVYYGHDASRGLDLQNITFGLDSRCVYGGQLTAMDIKTHWYTQVECDEYYD